MKQKEKICISYFKHTQSHIDIYIYRPVYTYVYIYK